MVYCLICWSGDSGRSNALCGLVVGGVVMAMSKKHFIVLADMLRRANQEEKWWNLFTETHLDVIADFCKSQNPRFMRGRWLDYVAGKCGPNGGKK